jgi:hypothetical protein
VPAFSVISTNSGLKLPTEAVRVTVTAAPGLPYWNAGPAQDASNASFTPFHPFSHNAQRIPPAGRGCCPQAVAANRRAVVAPRSVSVDAELRGKALC